MSITGNNNCLIGAGATLPNNGNNQVVVGSAISTVFLGGSAVKASASELTLGNTVMLKARDSAGTLNQVLKSTGSGIEWASVANPASTNFTSTTVSAAYTTYICTAPDSASPTLTLLAPTDPTMQSLKGVQLAVKNMSINQLTISSQSEVIVVVNTRTPLNTINIGSGGSCILFSNGTYWFMLDVSGAPAAPGTPTNVTITTPSSSPTLPTTMSVSWTGDVIATRYIVQIAQIVNSTPTYLGAIEAGTGATSAVVAASSGSYNTISTDLFRAYVTPYNTWFPGTTGNSILNDYSQPTNVTITLGSNFSSSWSPPSFTSATYEAVLRLDGTGVQTITTSNTTCTFNTNLVDGGIYDVVVTALNGSSRGTLSTPSSSIQLPSPPVNISIAQPSNTTPQQLNVSWQPAGGAATSYRVRIILGSEVVSDITTGGTSAVVSRTNGSPYSISASNLYTATVVAINGNYETSPGQSTGSYLCYITTLNNPTYTIVTSQGLSQLTSVTGTWSGALASYQFYLAFQTPDESGNFSNLQVSPPLTSTSSSYTFNASPPFPLFGNRSFRFRIQIHVTLPGEPGVASNEFFPFP